jgi:hypothetical protein
MQFVFKGHKNAWSKIENTNNFVGLQCFQALRNWTLLEMSLLKFFLIFANFSQNYLGRGGLIE